MCIGYSEKEGTNMRWNLPLGVLYLFLFLGANDPTAMILEKITALEESFRQISLRLVELEKRVETLEKARPAEAKRPAKALPPARREFIDIGQGFYALNLSFKGDVNNTIFTGEIENTSTKDYQFMLFNIEVYDEKGNTLGSSSGYVMDIPMGARKPFEVVIYGANAREVARYAVKYVKGS